jgi:hypothetical protein
MFAHLIKNDNAEEIARHIQGIIPDIVINGTAIMGDPSTIYDDKISITDIKTLARSPEQLTTQLQIMFPVKQRISDLYKYRRIIFLKRNLLT